MALTVSQIREHVGAMFQFGLQNATFLAKNGLSWRELIMWAREYRTNGSLGTITDRTEAMKAFLRYSFQQTTGTDPAANLHYYQNHWLAEVDPALRAALGE